MKDISTMREEIKRNIDLADENVVAMVYEILDDKEDFFSNLTEEQELALQEAIKQSDNGEGVPHDEVKKRYKQWFTE